LVYSVKFFFFFSTLVITGTAYSFFVFPVILDEVFDFEVFLYLLPLTRWKGYQKWYFTWFDSNPIRKNTYVTLFNGLFEEDYGSYSLFFFKEVSSNDLSLFFPTFNFFFSIINFFIIFFFLDLFIYFFLKGKKSLFWFKLYGFFKTNIFLSFNFLTSIDLIVSFTYFFFSLYFLEIHFFFIYSLNLSTDTFIYQFNFLLSSFFFVFFVKLLHNVFTSGFFFSVNFNFNEFFFFSSANFAGLGRADSTYKLFASYLNFVVFFRFFFRMFFFVFFFFSTFFVWFLRYLIQFVRLLVLFMIHTIFELLIIGNDSFLVIFLFNYMLIFKYVFFVFFYIFLFLYLILYLNLMFTLQVFIFYFFSEVFQSNFITDLSAFIAAKAKRL